MRADGTNQLEVQHDARQKLRSFVIAFARVCEIFADNNLKIAVAGTCLLFTSKFAAHGFVIVVLTILVPCLAICLRAMLYFSWNITPDESAFVAKALRCRIFPWDICRVYSHALTRDAILNGMIRSRREAQKLLAAQPRTLRI